MRWNLDWRVEGGLPEKVLLLSLQGLANRTEPALYIIHPPEYQWEITGPLFEFYERKHHVQFTEIKTADEALTRFAKAARGYVVWDPAVSATMNATAAAKTGLQRAVTHNNNGKNKPAGSTAIHGSRGNKTMIPLAMMSRTNIAAPSLISWCGGGSRSAETSPIKSGATVTMPIASDRNQWCQIVRKEVDELWNSRKPNVPTIPEMAVATTAAASSPMTLRSRSRLNDGPK